MISDAEEHRLRFAVFETVASEPRLNRRLIARGAGVIRHFYNGPRPSHDQDFLIVRNGADEDSIDEPEHSRSLLDAALVRRLPHHYPDYSDRLPWLHREMKIELAPGSEPIECRAIEMVPGSGQSILVVTLEDAIAIKLVAMVHRHPGAKKLREQDVYDVAEVLSRPGGALDTKRTMELAAAKAERHGFKLAADQYDEAVRTRLSLRYDALRQLTGARFIPFEEAWSRLMELLSSIQT